jgi:hypothetical protein
VAICEISSRVLRFSPVMNRSAKLLWTPAEDPVLPAVGYPTGDGITMLSGVGLHSGEEGALDVGPLVRGLVFNVSREGLDPPGSVGSIIEEMEEDCRGSVRFGFGLSVRNMGSMLPTEEVEED